MIRTRLYSLLLTSLLVLAASFSQAQANVRHANAGMDQEAITYLKGKWKAKGILGTGQPLFALSEVGYDSLSKTLEMRISVKDFYYHFVFYWHFHKPSGLWTCTQHDSNGGYHFYTSDGWTDAGIRWTEQVIKGIEAPEGGRYRFLINKQDQNTFDFYFESDLSGEWTVEDKWTFRRENW